MQTWKLIKRLWMRFVDVLGQVQTTLMLSIVYHLTVGPLSLFCRVTGRDLLTVGRPKLPSGKDTYAVALERISSTLETAKRQF